MDSIIFTSKGVGRRRITANALVSHSPCYVCSVDLVASAIGAATAVIRDGGDANAEALVDLSAIANSVDSRVYDPPLFFSRGVFVDVGSNVTAVLIRFVPSPGGG